MQSACTGQALWLHWAVQKPHFDRVFAALTPATVLKSRPAWRFFCHPFRLDTSSAQTPEQDLHTGANRTSG